MAVSTRSCSAMVRARTSTWSAATGGTTLIAIPADATVGVTVVPLPGISDGDLPAVIAVNVVG